MAQAFDPNLELDQDNLTLDTLAPSTHPPLILPEGTFSADPKSTPVFGFAPAPTGPAASVSEDCQQPAAPEDIPPLLTRPTRRFRISGYEAIIIALMLGCAALCIYRLIWAMQS